jgi:NADH-quinone oxidoreductase subunit A
MAPIGAWTADTWSLIVYVVAVFGLIAVMLGLSWLLGGRAWGRAKNEPFESGVVGAGGAEIRISAKFYQVAIFFVIFDLEAAFLYVWAISVKEVGWYGFIGAAVFLLILVGSLVYEWGVGALEWAPQTRKDGADPRVRRKALRADPSKVVPH